jgi:cytochrome P450
MGTTTSDLYYDPYNFEIDTDPYPVWQRMRDEAPLYYNEKYDFYALSRFTDVERGLVDWRTYTSAKGSVLEQIKSDKSWPLGMLLSEDPPEHDIHRSLLARVFTPRRMSAIEPQVRRFCARSLDPFRGAGRFDFVTDLGAQMPMRTIGMLLGIPESDQEAIRDHMDEGLRLKDGTPPSQHERTVFASGQFEEYIEWRSHHPSDDLMTELLNAEFQDEHGVVRTLTRAEVKAYVALLAGAGNETTTRLIGWTGKLLAEHPDQRRMLLADPGMIPAAIEEILRFETPSPVTARYVTRDIEHHGVAVGAGNVMLMLMASANRDDRQFEHAGRFDITRRIDRHVAFAYGIHYCLGAALARLEGRVALDEVLKRFPEWEVDWDNAVQAHTSTVRGWEKLPVFIS